MTTTEPIPQALAAPVGQHDRITLLDSLRGIAILGILLMNIPGFGLPAPLCYGDLSVLKETGANFTAWYGIGMTIEGTQRALFSMLFGAGMLLFIGRKEQTTVGLMPAEYFFRRQLWLLLFGLFNAFVLLWFWDILFQYAVCGMILFVFRRLSPRNLLIGAVVCLGLQTARDNVLFYRDKTAIVTGEALAKRDTTQVRLTADEKEKVAAMTAQKERSSAQGKKKAMEKSLQKVRGSYTEFYEYQSDRSFQGEVHYTYNGLWDVLIFMFLGMAFYKNGLLLGRASSATYWGLFLGGMGIGMVLTWFHLQPAIDLNYNRYEITKQVPIELYEVARAFRSVGILGLIMVLYKSGLFGWLFSLMRPVGQMAFTNYLMQSLMVGLFFYGIGFGMFGKLQRFEIYYVVGVVWVIQIIWSHLWLRFFRFGPLEWLWRSLTYWQFQPMKR